jgi:hypothetical protein
VTEIVYLVFYDGRLDSKDLHLCDQGLHNDSSRGENATYLLTEQLRVWPTVQSNSPLPSKYSCRVYDWRTTEKKGWI